jgi:hypothetical protein
MKCVWGIKPIIYFDGGAGIARLDTNFQGIPTHSTSIEVICSDIKSSAFPSKAYSFLSEAFFFFGSCMAQMRALKASSQRGGGATGPNNRVLRPQLLIPFLAQPLSPYHRPGHHDRRGQSANREHELHLVERLAQDVKGT